MKLLVRQYLQSMKERGELDVLLPHLLSELGYEILHHPKIGGRQAGVDIAAVGPDPDADGKKSLLLFVIKSGDIGRRDWADGALQAVRPSLEEVIYDYIPNRISDQYRRLPIVVCVCMGGEIQEGIRALWRGFVKRHKTNGLNFREWNGDRLANLILLGPLKQELLNVDHRSHFQKAIALVSEPEASYHNFRVLLNALTKDISADKKGTTRLRQMMICLWILVGNGVDAGNLDAPYRACELAMLHAWDAFQRCPKSKKARYAEHQEIFDHALSLYLEVGDKFIVEKIGPHAKKRHALSSAVRSRSALDVNLALFETLGRTVLLGLWHHNIGCASDGDKQSEHFNKRDRIIEIAVSMVNANPTLRAPMRDDYQIEIGMFVLLLLTKREAHPSVDTYLRQVAERLCYGYVRRSNWAKYYQDYQRLANHLDDHSDAHFEHSTSGSVLVPFILLGLELTRSEKELKMLWDIVRRKLPHMTQQVLVPNERTDNAIWRGGEGVGTCIPVPSLTPKENSTSLLADIEKIISKHPQIMSMKVLKHNLLPLLLTACRHHRIPLPPHLWFKVWEKTSSSNNTNSQGRVTP